MLCRLPLCNLRSEHQAQLEKGGGVAEAISELVGRIKLEIVAVMSAFRSTSKGKQSSSTCLRKWTSCVKG